MIRHARAALALHLAAALTVGCGGSLLTPADPDEVTITLSVSGGFAGVDYTVVVDGAAGEVRGGPCSAHCAWQPGDVLMGISDEQVGALAAEIEGADIFALNGRDFGDSCCDIFHYVLTYERGDRSATVEGTDDRFPARLAATARVVSAMAQGHSPAVVAPHTRFEDWPRDPYVLGDVRVEGRTLVAEVTYGGGCEAHRFDLVVYGGWMESFPVQVNALIAHDDRSDPCEAIVHDVRSFNLLPLREAYEEAYGEIGADAPTIVLRLWDPVSASPVGRLIEIIL